MGHYADGEISGSEYEGALCVFDQSAFWEDNVSMCSNGGVKRCTLWVSTHVSGSTGKLSAVTLVRGCPCLVSKWTTLETIQP